MAGRVLNRRELRKQSDQAEAGAGMPAELPDAAPPQRKSRAKAPAGTRVRKARPKKAPARTRARWGVFDGGMKQVAVFDYNQRAAADEKLAGLNATRKGHHFV